MAEYTLRMTSQQNHPPVPHLVPGDRAVLDFPMRGVFAGRQGQDLVFSRTDGGKLVLPGVFAAHTLPGTLPAPGEFPGEAPENLMGKASSLLDTADKPGGTLHLIVHGRDMSLEEFLAALGKEDMPESGMAPSARVRFHEYADAELMHGIGGLGGLELSLSRTGYETAPRYDTLPTRQDKENDQLPARGGLPDTPVPPAHHVPTVDSFAYALAEDGVPDTVSGNALAGAHPGDGNNIFAWVTPPSAARYGSISLNPDGTFTYTIDNSLPIVQELGVGDQVVEHFIYTYTDAAGEKATGSLDISIIGTNDVPTVAASTASVSGSGSAGVPSGVSGILPAPHDPDAHDMVSFLPQNGTPGAYGTFTLHTDGTWSYDLDNNLYAVRALAPGDSLTETFTYTVSDNHGGTSSNTLTVTINGTNDAPTVAAAATSVTEDTQLTTSGTLPAPSDPDRGDTIAFVPQNGTLRHYGSLTLGADGSYTYTLNNNLYAVQSLGAGETLTDTFTYTVTDSHGAIGSNTLTVTINGTNDAPTVAAAIASVAEDAQTTATGTLPTPLDMDTHDSVSFLAQNGTPGTYGTLTLNADGSYAYALDNTSPTVQGLGVGETLTDTFTYTVTDNHGATASNTLTVTIHGTNDAPTVAAAAASVTEDSQTTASGILPTPQDMDTHDSVSFLAQNGTPGTYGTFTLNADGSYTYILNNSLPAVQSLGAGETLTDTFTYTVTDNHGAIGSNTLTVTIHGTNDAPTVAAAAASVTEDTQITTSGTLPTPQDTDTHDTVSFVAQSGTPGTYGTFTLNADGSYTYVLNNSLPAIQTLGVGETLTDTITYTVSDGHGGTASNTLTVTISGTNDAPTVAAAAASVTENTQISASGTLPQPQDTDLHDTVAFTPKAGEAGTYGSLTLNADGSYTYTLNNASPLVQGLGAGETVADTFTYTVSDSHGGTASNTLTVTISGTNDAPTVAAATASVAEDTQISASGTLPQPQDTDIRDTVAFTPLSNAAGTYGTLTLNADGSYAYTLNNASPAVQGLGAGETATDVFTYTVTDGHGATASNTLTVTIHGTNDAPTVAAAVASVTEDTQILASGTLPVPHDTDTHDTVAFTPKLNETGTYGSLTLNADGTYIYTLNNASPAVQGLGAGETATDVFTYTVTDGHGGTGSNTLTVTIRGTNDVPTVAAATASGTLPLPQDTDIHDTLTFTTKVAEAGLYGTLTLNADGSYTYTLNNASPLVQGLGAGESVTDAFIYTASDGHGGTVSNTLTVTINGTNDTPSVAAATASVVEDLAPTVSGTLPHPTDTDIHDAVAFIPQSNAAGAYGSLTLNANGTYTYILNNGLPAVQALNTGGSLTDTFTYTVNDGHGGTASNTLTVTIHGTDEGLPGLTVSDVVEDVRPFTQVTLPVPSDPGGTLGSAYVYSSSSLQGQYGVFTIAADGTATYTLYNSLPSIQGLGQGETLTDTLAYSVSNSQGVTLPGSFTVTIHGTNDIPTVAAAVASVTEDTKITASGTLPAPQDADIHDTVAFLPQTNTAGLYGSLTLSADGTYTYTLNNASPLVQGLGTGESVTDAFTYTVSDGHGGTASNTLTVTINGTEDLPVLTPATASVREDVQLTASGVVPLPFDADIRDTLTFTAKANEAGRFGTLTMNADGTYTYTLNNSLSAVQALGVGETLTDVFQYTVTDSQGGSSSSTLTVTINGTNDVPTVAASVASVTEDTKITASGILPTPQDTDIHDPLAFTPKVAEAGLYGKLTLAANGSYTYTLNNSLPAVQRLGVGETATDTFTYTVSDGHGGTATNTLTVTIKGTNDAPTIGASTASVTEDTLLTATGSVPVPRDPDVHDVLSIQPMSNVAGTYGTLTLNADGTYTYTLNNSLPAVQALGAGERLLDVFTYTVRDNHGATGSNTLTVTINGTNDTPSVGNATATVTEDTQTTATGFLPSPTDPDAHDSVPFLPQNATAGLYGTLTLRADASYTYALNNALPAVQALGVGETLSDTFTYTVSDGHGGTASNTLTVTISGTNDTPVASAAIASVIEDTQITTAGTLPPPRDIDIRDSVSFVPQPLSAGTYGTLTLAADGTYTYTLNNSLPAVQSLGAGETLTDTLSYGVVDNHGAIGTGTLTVTISGTNDAPTATAAAASVTEDLALTATGVLPPPRDVDIHDTLSFLPKAAEPGLYGTLTLRADGSYTYTLNNALPAVQALGVGETLTDTFTCTVSDGHGGTGSSTLTITVNGTDDAPSVAAAAASVTEDTGLTASGTLPAPTDPDAHDTPVFIPKTAEAGLYGSLTLNADGTYTYTLNNGSAAVQALGAGEKLADTFTYTVSDGHGGTASNTLTVTINGTNDAPSVAAAADSVKEDAKLTTSGILPAPTDPDAHDTPVFAPKTAEAGLYGSLTLNADGSYTYTLNNALPAVQTLGVGETLTDTFTYTVSDGHGGTASNTLTLTINGTNDTPSVGPTFGFVTEDTLTVLNGALSTPTDPDTHDMPVFVAKTAETGLYGSLTLRADGTYTYTLNNSMNAVQGLGQGETLRDIFTYTVSDGHGGTASNVLTVIINGTNDAPAVAAAVAAVTEDAKLTATGKLPTPTDIDNSADGIASDTLSFIPQIARAGAYGTLTLNADGTYVYTLNNTLGSVQALGAGETLTDVLTYTVTDGKGGTASNTLTVTITGTNDAPVVAAATATVAEDTRTTASGTLPAPQDIDAHDTVSFIPKTGEAGRYGTLTLNADGTYTYVLNNNLAAVQGLGVGDTLSEVFLYTVKDSHGAVGNNTLTITIQGTNDAPTASPGGGSVKEDSVLTASGRLAATDPDNTLDGAGSDALAYTPKVAQAGLYGTLTLNADGTWLYALNNSLGAVQGLTTGETLTDTFTYTVTDNHGAASTGTLTITVNGANDPPLTTPATVQVAEDAATVASGTLPAPSDPDNTQDGVISDILSFVPATVQGIYGTLVMDAAGRYTYTLNNSLAVVQRLGVGETLQEVFSYAVQDQHGGISTNTLTVTVNGTNDAPTVAAAAASVTEDAQITASGSLPAPRDTDTHDTVAFIPQTATAGTYGTLTVNADGTYLYTLNNNLPAVQALQAGQTLTDTFTYTVTDNRGGTGSNTLTVTISGLQETGELSGPGNVTEDVRLATSGTLPVPADPLGILSGLLNGLTYSATTLNGLYGTFTLNANGSYTYTLNNNLGAVQGLTTGETLLDVLPYKVTNILGAALNGSYAVTIHGTNDTPVAPSVSVSVQEDTLLLSSGIIAATDPDNTRDGIVSDLLSFTPQTTAGLYGTLTLNAAGAYTYTLNNSLSVVQALGQGESLSETFNYTVKDQHGGITVGTLTVNISGTNDLPVPTVQTASLTEDVKAVALGSLRPVPDPDVNDIVTFVPQSSTAGLYGTLTLNANGSYVYVLNNSSAAVQGLGPGESVTDTFAYAVSDGHGGTAASTLTLTINGTNDAPTVGAASASIGEEAAGPANALSGLLPTPYDADIRDTVSFVPQTNRAGTWGTLTLRADGTYTYALTDSAALHSLGAGQIAYDTFAYTVADNHGASVTNTLTITVIGVNDAPSVASATASVQEDTLLTASGILPAPTDPDAGDRPQFVMQLSTQGQYGTLFLSPAGAYTYTLNNGLPAVHALGEGDTLTDTFTYTVTDGHGGTATNTLTVTINGTNDAPTVDAADAAITEGVAQTAGTLPTPQDPDAHDVPVFVPQTGAAGLYGSLTLDASGAYVYTLNNSLAVVKQLGLGETLTDTFTYTVTDNHGGTATNTLTVTVNGINTPPLTGTITAGSVTEDTSTVLTGIMTAPPDPNPHDTVVFLPQLGTAGAYGTLTLAASGRYTYVLNNTLPAVQGLGVGETLTDTLAATVSDGKGGLTQTTLAITINGTNDLPSVAPSSGAITEDTAILAGTLSLPTDPDIHDTPAFLPQLGTAGAYGTLTLNADGTYSYALNNSLSAVQGLGVGETLTDSFAYTVSDGHGGTASNTLTITISGANDAPAALAATASVTEDTALSASGVLPRPSDPDFHDTVAFIPLAARAGAYGTLTLAADGHYTYVLNNTLPAVQGLGVGETLTDTITYQVIDNHGATGSATLTVTINGTNDNPIVTPLTASILETAASVSGVLPAPTDPDIHDAPAYVPIAARAGIYGSLTLNADGSYTYVLNQSQPAVQGLGQGETLTDTFAYSVVDGHGGAASGTLTVTVNGINNPPTVAASAAVIAEHTSYVTGVLPSPDDPDIHDTVSFTPATLTGRYGTLSLDAHGGYVYTLNAHSPDVSGLGQGESLTDTITYGIADDKGGTGTGTLTVTINGTNDAPVLGPQAASVSVGGTVTAAGTLIAGDPDAHDTVSFTPFTAQAGLYGTLTLNADGTYAYTLNSGLSAVRQLSIGDTLQDVFLCQAQDQYGLTGSGTLTVTINGGNEAPTVAAATASVTEDLALTATGTLPVPQDINIHDAIGFVPLSAQAGTYGTLTLTAGGRYIYVLNNALPSVQALGTGETLTDTFTYQAIDNHGAIGSNTLTVTINGTNDAPTMSLAAAAFARTDLTLTGVLPPPHDPDAHDTASYQPLTAQAGLYGTLTLNADGTYTYVLNSTLDTVRELGAGESLQDVFSCTVIDSHGTTGAGVFTITINGSNDAPTAADATASVTAAVSGDQVLATGILPHPADPNIHDVLSFVPLAAEAGSYGTLTLAADGSWTYTLNNAADAVRQLGAGATLTDTITYQVADNHGATGNATLSVTIYGVNDLPAVAAATASVTEDTAAAASGILPAPTDPDSGDSVSFVPIAGGAGLFGTLNLDADGHYTYTLNNSLAAVQGLGEGQTLTDTFTYTVTDAHGGTGSNTLTVTINGVNDSPSVAAATADVTEDVQTLVTGTLPAPHDPDNYGVPNDILSFTPQIAEPGAYGSLTLNADGTYTYILNNALPAVQNLNAGNTLTDTFTYTVTDNHGGTGSNTLTVTIHGLDEPSGGGTYAAPQTASLSVTAETGEAVPPGTGATSTLPDYLQPEGDSLASVLNHYASSGSGQGHETAATDGTPPEDGAAPDASPLPSSEDGGAPTVSAPTETAVHDAQPQQYSEPYTPPMESSTETLQQNVSQELARNGGI
ncbi:VCBS domain-containing protein [Bilophila wadsworthia]